MPATYSDSRLDSKAGGIDMSRLCRAMSSANRSLQPFRQDRLRNLAAYVAGNYGRGDSESRRRNRMLVNGLALFVQVMSQQVVGVSPRFMLSTLSRKAKPTVAAIQDWLNPHLDRIGLADTLREAAVDSFFCLGITKVALSTPSDAAVSGWQLPAGEPFVANIDLDDFVFDQHARRLKEASFFAHRFRMPLEIAREWQEFSAKQRKELQASDDPEFTETGDDRAAWLSRNEEGIDEEFEEMVDLWEVYLPRHKLVLTIQHDGLTHNDSDYDYDEPLRVQRWIGPDEGPYHFLASGPPVPGNPMPKALIQDIADLNNLINNVWRKIEDDAKNWKSITAVAGGADADGKRLIDHSHGDAIRVDNPEAVREIVFRGVNPVMFNFVLQARNSWNMQAGNLDLQAGTAPQSRTASQDKMLNENAGAMVAALQSRVTSYAAGVGSALAWFYHHSPYLEMDSEYVHPGLPDWAAINRPVTPQDRMKIPWGDLRIRIDPYSMPFSSPSQQLATLNAVLQNVMPMMPLLQQQGKVPDIDFYLRKVAEYTAQPDIAQLFRLSEPTLQEAAGGGAEEMPHMLPGATSRTYERRSVGQESQGAQEQAALNMTSPEFSQNQQ